MLPSAPKQKNNVMCTEEKPHVLDKLYSAMRYTAADWKFNANESIIWYKGKRIQLYHAGTRNVKPFSTRAGLHSSKVMTCEK